jgi:hypothetical protein
MNEVDGFNKGIVADIILNGVIGGIDEATVEGQKI